MARVGLTGNIGKPLLTLHGELDTLLPIRVDSDVYRRMIVDAGRGDQHRYYRIAEGNHIDEYYNDFPGRLRPILPCQRDTFRALEMWVEQGKPPPQNQVVPKGSGDVVNYCGLLPGQPLVPPPG